MATGTSMGGELLRLHLPTPGLTASVVLTTGLCHRARELHRLERVSALLLAQGITGGVLLASLLKGEHRINLQVECDGPLHGLLVDAGADGSVRGYAKNPNLDVELGKGPFRWRPALGNAGFLSALRPLPEGEYYRSSVELTHFALDEDLRHYFAVSDQVPTKLAWEVVPDGDEPLGTVAGVLVQTLPDGDLDALEAIGAQLQQRLQFGITSTAQPTVDDLAAAVLTGFDAEPLARLPLVWRCTCTKQRVLAMLASLGKEDLQALLDERGGAQVTCHFCGMRHEASREELAVLLHRLGTQA